MKNWLRQKLQNFLYPQYPQDNEATEARTPRRGILTRGSDLNSKGMCFTIHQASGGYVLEYSAYDDKTDRHNHNLHIIPSDQDMGQGIAHIITLEMLRK
jgi:hypothetical protein